MSIKVVTTTGLIALLLLAITINGQGDIQSLGTSMLNTDNDDTQPAIAADPAGDQNNSHEIGGSSEPTR
jgi:hypothetical protein